MQIMRRCGAFNSSKITVSHTLAYLQNKFTISATQPWMEYKSNCTIIFSSSFRLKWSMEKFASTLLFVCIFLKFSNNRKLSPQAFHIVKNHQIKKTFFAAQKKKCLNQNTKKWKIVIYFYTFFSLKITVQKSVNCSFFPTL